MAGAAMVLEIFDERAEIERRRDRDKSKSHGVKTGFSIRKLDRKMHFSIAESTCAAPAAPFFESKIAPRAAAPPLYCIP